MSESSIPPEAVAFLRSCVDSLIELEVMLLLHRTKERDLSAASIAAELRIDRDTLESHLDRLSIKNVVDVKIAEDVLYRLRPLARERATALDILDAIYPDRRLAIAETIEAGPAPELDFANAFRLRRSKPVKTPKGKK